MRSFFALAVLSLFAIAPLASADLVNDVTDPVSSGSCSTQTTMRTGGCGFSCAPFSQLGLDGSAGGYVDAAGRWSWARAVITATCGGVTIRCYTGRDGSCGANSGDLRTRQGDRSGSCTVENLDGIQGVEIQGHCAASGGNGVVHSACAATLDAEWNEGFEPGDAAFDDTYDACVYLVTLDPAPPPDVRP